MCWAYDNGSPNHRVTTDGRDESAHLQDGRFKRDQLSVPTKSCNGHSGVIGCSMCRAYDNGSPNHRVTTDGRDEPAHLQDGRFKRDQLSVPTKRCNGHLSVKGCSMCRAYDKGSYNHRVTTDGRDEPAHLQGGRFKRDQLLS